MSNYDHKARMAYYRDLKARMEARERGEMVRTLRPSMPPCPRCGEPGVMTTLTKAQHGSFYDRVHADGHDTICDGCYRRYQVGVDPDAYTALTSEERMQIDPKAETKRLKEIAKAERREQEQQQQQAEPPPAVDVQRGGADVEIGEIMPTENNIADLLAQVEKPPRAGKALTAMVPNSGTIKNVAKRARVASDLMDDIARLLSDHEEITIAINALRRIADAPTKLKNSEAVAEQKAQQVRLANALAAIQTGVDGGSIKVNDREPGENGFATEMDPDEGVGNGKDLGAATTEPEAPAEPATTAEPAAPSRWRIV